MKKVNTKSGFTLIELLVVIAVIGILSAVVTSTLQSARIKARNAERLQAVDQINKAMEIYSTASGLNRLPSVLDPVGGDGYNTSWYCLGAVDTTTCAGTTLFDIGLNTAVKSGFTGEIPQNKLTMTGNDSWYRYVSANSSLPAGAPFANGTGGLCDATTCPPGAYIIWAMEKVGSEKGCGRGVLQNYGSATSYTCVLRVGDRIKY